MFQMQEIARVKRKRKQTANLSRGSVRNPPTSTQELAGWKLEQAPP